MEKQRNIKILSIVALVLAIAGMSLGFAAFSTTLNISSSASVSPSSSSFSLGFYPSQIPTLDDGILSPTTSGGATGSNVTLSPGSTTITGLNANFTEPGQTIEYSFYVGNEGEYDAYLRAINFLNVSGKTSNKVCTPGTGTTASLVEATCEAITMTVEVNGTIATSTNTSISGNTLAKGAFTEVNVTISYAENGARADGPFTVDFGGISLDYSTVDGAIELITFNIKGRTYQAEKGMTWDEFINSEYNNIYETREFMCMDGNVYDRYQSKVSDASCGVIPSEIIAGKNYDTNGGEPV